MLKGKKLVGILMALMFVSMLVFGSVAMAADSVTLTGNVEVDDDGNMVLNADGDSYILEGTDEDWAGKEVKATGTVSEEGDNKYLMVDTIEEVG